MATSLSLPALRLLVAVNPWGARYRLLEALQRVREERGALAEAEFFEATIAGQNPDAKFDLRDFFGTSSLSGSENRRLVLALRQACREADRVRLTPDQVQKHLAKDDLDTCLELGLIRPNGDGRWEVILRILDSGC